LDLFNIGKAYVQQRSTKIDPSMIDVEGSDVNIVVGSQSVMGDAVVKQLAYSTARQTLDGSFKEDLDRWALDRYQLLRKGASPAVGQARLSRPNATAGAGSVPIGTQIQARTGAVYVTTTVGVFGATQIDNVFVNVRAATAGKATQAAIGQLFKMQSPGSLFDRTITVTNDTATAGGEDVEDDDTFKTRLRNFWNAARRGVIAAIEYGATTVPGVVSAQAVEVTDETGMAARLVNLYIADSTGVASQALADQVSVALFDYRAAGIAVIIGTSIPLLVPVELSLSFLAGVDTISLTQLVLAAVVGYVNSLPVNSPLLIGDLQTVLNRFKPEGLVAVQNSIVSPAGDLYPPIGQTIRTTAALVTSA
jgi:hypothetical protein